MYVNVYLIHHMYVSVRDHAARSRRKPTIFTVHRTYVIVVSSYITLS